MRDRDRPRVLIVDDEEHVRRSLARILDAAGFDTSLAESGEQALESMASPPLPDLVLLDVDMPTIDGYEVCVRMQADEALSYVPVVFVTAMDSERDRSRAFAAGASEFMTKPVEAQELTAVVHRQIETRDRWEDIRNRPQRQPSWLLPSTFLAFKRHLIEQWDLDEETRRMVEGVGPEALYELARMLHVPDERIGRYLARFLDIPVRERIHGDEAALGVLPAAFCQSNMVVPLTDGTVVVANPFDWELMDVLERTLWHAAVPVIAVADPARLRAVTRPEDPEVLASDDEAAHTMALGIEAPEEEGSLGDAMRLANEILRGAVRERASDVHFEPKERGTLVRYRIDGDMQDIRVVDGRRGARIVSRLKAIAGMDIADRRRPQDGALHATLGERRFKLRLATSATADGETLIVRLLEPETDPVPLEALGMMEDQADQLRRLAAAHQGMILVVGPTGSGKSTTIFTLLCTVDGTRRSIMSVEDPVEYRIPHANQQQVNERAGVTFEALLRSAMRQDPDILFLGEVRDPFSARAVLDFASSGHLTISTLHSSNATTAVFRLERLGVERGAMADALSGVVAQKLLKRLCPECKEWGRITEVERAMLSPFTDDVPAEVARPVGCPACRETGFHGREAIYEILGFDADVGGLVRKGAAIAEIRRFCTVRGDYLISRHGIDKVREGLFSVRSVYENVLLEEQRFRGGAAPKGQASDSEAPDEPRGDDPGVEVSVESVPKRALRFEEGDAPGPPSILVVDDDPDMRALVQLYLEKAGYEVLLAEDGVEALMMLAQRPVQAVLSDVQMPNLDGVKLMEMISQKGLDVPAIFLTGADDEGLEAAVLAHGAMDYIRKPVRREVLLLRVRNALLSRGGPLPPLTGATQ